MSKGFLLTFLLVGSLFAIKPNLNVVYVTTPQIGPFKIGEEAKTSVTLDFKLNESYIGRFRAYVKYNDYWSLVFGSERFLASNGISQEFSFDFPTYLMETEKPLYMSYRMYNDELSTPIIKYSLDYEIQISKPKSIDIATLTNGIYKGAPYALKINNNIISYYRDEFDFTITPKDLLEETYHYIDFRKIKFKEKLLMPFTVGDIKISFIDTYNAFPNLPKRGKSTYVNLMHKFDYGNECIYLTFKDKYYVNPKTLEVTTIPLFGYSETSVLYLPINKAEEVDGITFSLTISNMGFEINNYSLSLQYYYGNLLIGDCSKSDYCVVGELYD